MSTHHGTITIKLSKNVKSIKKNIRYHIKIKMIYYS